MKLKKKYFEEFETAFKTIKRDKASGIDDLNLSIILDVYKQIKYPLPVIFRSSTEKKSFSNLLKIAKVSLSLNLVMLPKLVIADWSQFYSYYQKY